MANDGRDMLDNTVIITEENNKTMNVKILQRKENIIISKNKNCNKPFLIKKKFMYQIIQEIQLGNLNFFILQNWNEPLTNWQRIKFFPPPIPRFFRTFSSPNILIRSCSLLNHYGLYFLAHKVLTSINRCHSFCSKTGNASPREKKI